jgi:hypothetical protein
VIIARPRAAEHGASAMAMLANIYWTALNEINRKSRAGFFVETS